MLDVQPPGLQGKGYTLRLKIDSGASGNTMPLRTLSQMYGKRKTDMLTHANGVKLTSYSGDEIPCLGCITMPCKYGKSQWIMTTFYVVDVPGPAVVGLPTSELLELITINVDTVKEEVNETQIKNIDLQKQYPDQFDKIGSFSGTARLLLKQDAEPFIDSPRKCSIHIKDKLKAELDRMEHQGVISKVTEHTDWCSSVAYSTKKDGSLRVCIDPQKLNSSLKRCPHKISTVEEINPKFANAKVFSKLDAKAGYWSIHLDEKSQHLTTFRTPFRRYCWKRLPFGLNVSQDLY